MDTKEKLAAVMLRHSIATGHGDTLEDLINELDAHFTRPTVPQEATDLLADPYYFRREHDGSGWSVCGPGGFILKKTDGPLDKNIAYIIAKLPSNQLSDALASLRDPDINPRR